jgi:NAD(P)H-dependent FMN reductase
LLPLDRSAGARRVSECVWSTATPPKASSGRTAASDIETEGIMTTKPRIAIVIGSTRPGRYADKAAGWLLKQAQARDDIEAELLDLLDHPLPFFNEKGPLISTPSENAEALRWHETLARYDGFIFVVAEYNHSITGALKNALDQAYKEWGRKPFTAIGYGGNSTVSE